MIDAFHLVPVWYFGKSSSVYAVAKGVCRCENYITVIGIVSFLCFLRFQGQSLYYIICSYLTMIRKKATGCGLSNMLLEAELISRFVKERLKGKHDERAMHCHKIMLESYATTACSHA